MSRFTELSLRYWSSGHRNLGFVFHTLCLSVTCTIIHVPFIMYCSRLFVVVFQIVYILLNLTLFVGLLNFISLPSFTRAHERRGGGGEERVTRASANWAKSGGSAIFWKSSTHLTSTTTGNHRTASIFSTAQGFRLHYSALAGSYTLFPLPATYALLSFVIVSATVSEICELNQKKKKETISNLRPFLGT